MNLKLVNNEIKATHPSRLLRVSNCVTFIVLIVVQAVCQTTIFGSSDLEISARFPTPLTPATWAFAIWAGIFALQGVGVVYQALPQGYKNDGMKQRYVNGIGYGWQMSWLGEIAWQILFLLESPLGMSLCLLSLAGALAAMGRTLYNMYSIHTAWLSNAAAVAALMVPQALHHTSHLEGAAAVLAVVVTGIDFIGPVLTIVTASVGRSFFHNSNVQERVAILQKHRDSAYGLTLVWALVAIYGQQRSPFIRIVSLICICVAILASIFSMLRRKSPNSQEPSEIRQPLSHMNSV